MWWPAPDPSVASETARQLRRFAQRTSRPARAQVFVEWLRHPRGVGVFNVCGVMPEIVPGCRRLRWRPAAIPFRLAGRHRETAPTVDR